MGDWGGALFTSSVPVIVKRRERGSVVKHGNAWLVRVSAGTDLVTGKRLWLCGTCGSVAGSGIRRWTGKGSASFTAV